MHKAFASEIETALQRYLQSDGYTLVTPDIFDGSNGFGAIGCVALVNNGHHKKFVMEWLKKQLLLRLGDDKHHMHDAELSDDVRRVFSGLFANDPVAGNDADDDAMLSDGDEEDVVIAD